MGFRGGTGRPTVHLAASLGGHLELLRRVAPALDDHDLVWVTSPGRAAERLREAGERVRLVPPLDRASLNLSNPRRGVGVALRERPRVVITSGAGGVVAFVAAARTLGARVLFVETTARVHDSSASGRVLSRLAHQALVQWPEMRAVFPGATVCRPALLEAEWARPPAGEGTIVAVGSHNQPFDRLLAAADRAVDEGVLPSPALAQTGVARGTYARFRARPWWPPEQLEAAVRDARVVVCHAGSGIMSTAIRSGRRPIVVPRRGHLEEHVDDHQLQLAAKLAGLDLAVLAPDGITREHVEAAVRPLERPAALDAWPSLGEAVSAFAATARCRPATPAAPRRVAG